jgi:redox-sensitive bicupin YhaK (pirin superfamily)
MGAMLERAARPVTHVAASQSAPVGTFTVRRALPFRERHSIGPWVFLDHFGPFRVKPGSDGVGAHPHAGIETVTYLLSGRQEHRDSAGHRGIVAAGGVQWMTAGRGVIHAETPLVEDEAERTMHGLQLWTSLPRALKTMEPRYQRINAASIPVVRGEGWTARVIAGEFPGPSTEGGAIGHARGPAETLMPLFLWHVSLEPGAVFEAPIDATFEAAAYIVSGKAEIGDERTSIGELAVWGGSEPLLRVSNAGSEAVELMVLGGAPAEGPLVFHGPFVMNSVDQVRAAEVAYRTGRMGEL